MADAATAADAAATTSLLCIVCGVQHDEIEHLCVHMLHTHSLVIRNVAAIAGVHQ